MDRLGVAAARRLDDRLDPQVAVLGGRPSDRDRLVGERDVHRVAIGLREHRDGAQPQALGRAHDPAGDLAAIGDQELVEAPGEQGRHILKMPKRVGSGGGAFMPAASASPSTVRVSAGSMMPSSQRRAVA